MAKKRRQIDGQLTIDGKIEGLSVFAEKGEIDIAEGRITIRSKQAPHLYTTLVVRQGKGGKIKPIAAVEGKLTPAEMRDARKIFYAIFDK